MKWVEWAMTGQPEAPGQQRAPWFQRQEGRGRVGILLDVLVLVAWLLGMTAVEAAEAVRIGVLAYRSPEHTLSQWGPTARYLEEAIPGYRFQIVPLHNFELDKAVAEGQVEFVFTQPEHYVLLRAQYGLAALATLMPLAAGRPEVHFGGVIFTQAGRTDLHSLQDVKGKRIAGVYENSLGAYRMQQWALLKAGVELPRDASVLVFTGQPQDLVVNAVREGQVDVGFVRTGVLEAMAGEGKIRLEEFQIINRQPPQTFPQVLSTELYPEWPFSAMRGTTESLTKAVTLALLNIPSDSEAAHKGNYYGFSPPGDYTPLEAVLLRLKVHPGRLERFDLQDISEKYAREISATLGLLLILAVGVMVRLVRDRQRVKVAAQERDQLLSSLGDGIYGVNRNGRCTFINPAALEMLGLTENEVVGRNQHRLFHHHHPDGQVYLESECPVHATLMDGQHRAGEEWFFRKDGQKFPVRINVTAIRQGQQLQGAVVAFQDISEQRRVADDRRLAAVAFETQEGMLITDETNRILRVNQAFTQVTGFTAEEAVGQTPALLKSGRHDAAFYRNMWQELQSQGRWQGEIWNRRKNGEVYPEWLTVTAVRDGNGMIRHYVAAFLDISERKAAEARIEYMALYDSLTGLANRRLFLDRLRQALVSNTRYRRHRALLFIDLDNFKSLNDSMGHETGDQLLIAVAERLIETLRTEDTVARLGGDEFVIMLDHLGDDLAEAAAKAEGMAERLLNRLGEPYLLNTWEYHSTPSIGVVLFQEQDQEAEELIKQADLAMYQAKAAGRNTLRFFDPEVQRALEGRIALERELRRALKEGEFLLHYQPQVAAGGVIMGAEALLRWQHPVRGMVGPASFIPLAESTGLILPIGQWVLEDACRQLANWQQETHTATWTLAVNISARQFHLADFVHRVQTALALTGANPHRLKLELTESVLLDSIDDTVVKMEALRALGVGISLDDFGTGYSSLTYLKRLPLSQLKIDQSFVRDVLHDPNDAAIIRTILSLGETFGLHVIAEGVETEDQRDFLQQHGCQAFQGYLFGRPQGVESMGGPLNGGPP